MEAKDWQPIVRQYTPLVWRTVYRLLVHDADATDCLQETFVAAWELARRQTVRNWPALLQRLATARALDQLRRRRRQSKRHPASLETTDFASTQAGPPAQLQSTELAEHLRVALAQLPVQQSQAYCLRHLNEMSYEEIAKELGITVSAVGVNLHRATQRLRAALTPVLKYSQEPDVSAPN